MNSSKRGYVTWLSPFILHSFHLALAWIGSKMLWLQYLWVKTAAYSLLQFCNKQLHKKKAMKHAVPGLSLRFPMTFWGLLQVGRLSSPCKTQMLQSRPDAKAKGHTKPSEVDDEYLRTCVQRFLQFERLKLCLKRRAKKDFAYFYQYLFTIQLSTVKNYDFTLWIGLFCSWIQVWSSILSSCGWNAHDQAWGLKR